MKNFQNIPINVYNQDQLDTIFEEDKSVQTKQHVIDQSIIKKIRNKWGALTTFSRISGANRISISLPQGTLNVLDNLFILISKNLLKLEVKRGLI